MSKQKTSLSSKFEVEIERFRNENNWGRLRDYIASITVKDQKVDLLVKFCNAEFELENYLYKNPLQFSSNINNECSSSTVSAIGHNPHRTNDSLSTAEQTFKEIIAKSENNTIRVESSFLLAKLYYALLRYDDAYKQLSSTTSQPVLTSHLNKLRQNQQAGSTDIQQLIPKAETIRQYQIFSEAHSIKALCLERKKSATSPVNKQEEQDIIDSFEIASLLAIQHSILIYHLLNPQSNNNSINNANANNSNVINHPDHSEQCAGSANNSTLITLNALNNNDDNLDLINPLYEIALQKAPLLYIKKGDLKMGIRKFRDLLFKKNIQSITSIRQVLLKKYAECLMFNIPNSQYDPLPLTNQNDKNKPFKPNNQDEEILLCLVLSHFLASKEVMLLRQVQFKQIREHTLANAISSLDLMLFYLGYHRCYTVLSDKFEMVMKFSFEQFYVWYQYGLTLICDKKYYRAYLVLKECVRMKSDHVTCHLLLAKLALENLYFIDESIDWSAKVLEMPLTKIINAKALILNGCALCFKAAVQKQHSQQISFYEKALEQFKKAHALEPADFIPLYHIAHCYAILRQINESFDYVQKALKYKPDDKDLLHLLALLLTSTKNYDEAHTVINKACALYDDIELIYTKIRIEEILFGFNQSANSILNLILLYKQNQRIPREKLGSTNSSTVSTLHQSGTQNISKSPPQFNIPQNIENWSSFESAYMQDVYKLNEALGKTVTILVESDQLAFKYGNTISQSKNLQQLLVLVRILTQVGEFYLRHDKLNDAEACCQEIALKNPMSYLHIYLKGRIHEYKEEYAQAKLCYQNALSINPHHIQSLQQMSLVLCQMQNFHLAEKMIRDAISLNSSLPDSWHILARVLDYQNDNQSAMKCYQTCLQLELTNPIIPFTALTRTL